MKKTTGFYPRPRVDTAVTGAVGQAGGVLLTQAVIATGLGRELSAALAPWRLPFAVHDPAKVLLDLAIAVAIGGGAPGRCRAAARRAGGLRVGGLGPDDNPHDRSPGR